MVVRVEPSSPRRHLHLVGFRIWIERTRVIVQNQWKFYLGVVALILGIVGLSVTDLRETFSFVIGTLGVILGVGLMIPDVRALLRDSIDIYMVAPPGDYKSPVALIAPDGGEVVSQPDRLTQRAVVWPQIDRLLATSLLDCKLVQHRLTMPAIVRDHRLEVLRERLKGRDTFNGVVVTQLDDLTERLLSSDTPLRVTEGRYFDLACTNYLTNWAIGPAIGRPTFLWTLSQDPRTGIMRSLKDSELSNAIGVSTIAVTRDGKMILVGQANRAMASEGEWAPSGSGSIDKQDLPLLSDGPVKLRSLVCHAMERELQEEANLQAHEIEATYLTGYFRWVNMGGKPEYLGVTLLRVTSRELLDRGRRRVEKKFVRRIHFDIPFDIEKLRDSSNPLTALPDDVARTPSFPLFMALRAASSTIKADENLSRRLELLNNHDS